MRRFAFLVATLLTACHHSSADQTAYMRHMAAPVVAATPDHPTYLAKDYNRPGHPPLTASEVRLIRKTLVAVKSCQLVSWRYALPENFQGIALYFRDADAAGFPVLWERNTSYDVEEGSAGATSATMPGPDLRSVAAVRKFACNPQPQT